MATTTQAAAQNWIRLGRRVRVPRGATRQALLAPAVNAARLSRVRFARLIAWFLSRSILIVVERLNVGGFTWPLLPTNFIAPVIVLNANLLPGPPQELARILLHEGAHHCLVVWPEWRNWANFFARWLLFFIRWRDRAHPLFPASRIYGVGVNSADTVADAILRDAVARGWRP